MHHVIKWVVWSFIKEQASRVTNTATIFKITTIAQEFQKFCLIVFNGQIKVIDFPKAFIKIIDYLTNYLQPKIMILESN